MTAWTPADETAFFDTLIMLAGASVAIAAAGWALIRRIPLLVRRWWHSDPTPWSPHREALRLIDPKRGAS